MVYHLKHNGVMAIVLLTRFFSRWSSGTSPAFVGRRAIDTIIGLPANIFYNTSIPTAIIILKESYCMGCANIDAASRFERKNRNNMTGELIAKILETYQKQEDVEKFAHLCFEEIVESDYNLNIPRYVDTFEEEPVTPLADLADQLARLIVKLKGVEAKLAQMREISVIEVRPQIKQVNLFGKIE